MEKFFSKKDRLLPKKFYQGDNMTEKDNIMQFQQIQQQLQMMLMQKQNIQIQKTEISASLEELNKTQDSEVFEVVGTILVKKPKEELKKKLSEKDETIELRMSTIDKQIEKLQEKAKNL